MPRVRISTTVDEKRLTRARRLSKKPDSELIDQALQALIAEFEAIAELRALQAKPYEQDPDLAWEAADAPLPYDGDVPAEVLERARARRKKR